MLVINILPVFQNSWYIGEHCSIIALYESLEPSGLCIVFFVPAKKMEPRTAACLRSIFRARCERVDKDSLLGRGKPKKGLSGRGAYTHYTIHLMPIPINQENGRKLRSPMASSTQVYVRLSSTSTIRAPFPRSCAYGVLLWRLGS